MDTVESIIAGLEQKLLAPVTRSDPRRLGALLADDFLEVGASGRSFGKPEILASLPAEKGIACTASDMQVHLLAPDVALVTYRTERTSAGQVVRSRRSSVWVKSPHGWRMRYHQGTPGVPFAR